MSAARLRRRFAAEVLLLGELLSVSHRWKEGGAALCVVGGALKKKTFETLDNAR